MSILNGQLLTACESTVGLHGGDGKKSICVCVCVCVQAKGERMRESVREREREKDNGRMKEAGRMYCIHQMSTRFHYILLNKAFEKHGRGRPDCADRGTVAL